MSQNQGKPWERPWTTKEMIDNASNWNLAGDAGLLKYLEDFSDKMITKAKDTNDRLNQLMDTTAETSLALSNVTNKFMGLRNTQFIESRVYEDDETLPTEPAQSNETQTSKQTGAERLEDMKQAILNGLDIIDEYYEKVEIPESDSEDDTNGTSIMYRPIDPYIDRPLPYVIGTAQWHKYWHVGLAHSSSESEEENQQYSESESEPEKGLPTRSRSPFLGVSDSESDEMGKVNATDPTKNTKSIEETDSFFDSSSASEAGSLPPQVNTVNSNFAEQLAAKLGRVSGVDNSEVNRKPIKPPPKINGGLFSDEPPPLEEDGIFTQKNTKSELFSGGLFDDLDGDSDFWNSKAPVPKKTAPAPVTKTKDDLFSAESEDDNDIFFANKKPEDPNISVKDIINQPKSSGGIFDDDDDDIFMSANKPNKQYKNTVFPAYKPTVPLISNEPPELESPTQKTTIESKTKKPAGGVLVLGANLPTKNNPTDKSKIDTLPQNRQPEKQPKPTSQISFQPKTQEPSKPVEKKDISVLFDDTSPLFTDDIFSSLSSKKFTSGLFDSDDQPELGDDLFSTNKKKEVVTTEKEKTLVKEKSSSKQEVSNIETVSQTTKTDLQSVEKEVQNITKEIPNVSTTTTTEHVLSPKNDIPSTKNDFPTNKKDVSNITEEVRSTKKDMSNTKKDELDPKKITNVENNAPNIKKDLPHLEKEAAKVEPKYVSEEKDEIESKPYDIFSSKPPPLTTSLKKSSLFEDDDFEDNLFGPKRVSTPKTHDLSSKKKLSLFDDDNDDLEDSLFSSLSKGKSHNIFSPEPPELGPSKTNKSSYQPVSLFDPNPPDLDESDTKSESHSQLSLESESSNFGVISSTRATLFDSEPPLLQTDNNIIKPHRFKDDITGMEAPVEDLFSSSKPSHHLNMGIGKNDEQNSPATSFPRSDNLDDIWDDKPTPVKRNESLFSEKENVENIRKKNNNEPKVEKGNLNTKYDSKLREKNDDLFSETQGKNVKGSGIFASKESEDDLFNDAKVFEKKSLSTNIFESLAKSDNTIDTENLEEKKQTANSLAAGGLFDDNDKSEALFSQTDKTYEKRNIIEQSSNNTNNTLSTDKGKDVTKVITGKEEKIDDNINKIEQNMKPSHIDTNLPREGSTARPGKLKHNLNINVAALIPGSAPPKKQNLEKSTSLDSSESSQMKLSADEISSPVKSSESKPNLEKSISFDYPVETGEILTSAAKERVRIPVKRKPSTRKARHEAIRKSQIDSDNLFTENNDHEAKSEAILNIANNNIVSDKVKNPLANPLSPSTDEEDLFSVPRLQDISDNFKDNTLFGKAPVISPTETLPTDREKDNKEINPFNTTATENITPVKNILNSDEESDSEFGFTKTIPKAITSKFIFSSSDSDDLTFSKTKGNKNENNNSDLSPDDDLFKPVRSTVNLLSNPKLTTASKPLSKSLFEGEFSDEDLDLLSKSSVSKPQKPRTTVPTRKPIKEEIRKLPVEKGDPLDALKQ